PEVAGTAAGEDGERPLHQLAHLRHDQRHREHEQQGGPDLDLVLGADAEQPPQPCSREQERSEGRDEPGGDRVGPPLRSSSGAACCGACGCCCCPPLFFRLRRLRRRERPEVSFGWGRFSARAPATSWTVPSRSRAASISWFARGVYPSADASSAAPTGTGK